MDNIQKEKQQLEVELLRLSQVQPNAKAVVEIEKERDHWKKEYEGAMIENAQLRSLYEELLKHTIQETSDNSARGHQTMVESQEELHLQQVNVQQWKTKCEK